MIHQTTLERERHTYARAHKNARTHKQEKFSLNKIMLGGNDTLRMNNVTFIFRYLSLLHTKAAVATTVCQMPFYRL